MELDNSLYQLIESAICTIPIRVGGSIDQHRYRVCVKESLRQGVSWGLLHVREAKTVSHLRLDSET